MLHAQIRREIFAFANEMGYFPDDAQVETIRRLFEAAIARHLEMRPGAALKLGDETYDGLLWDCIEAVMRPVP